MEAHRFGSAHDSILRLSFAIRSLHAAHVGVERQMFGAS
jgi:hypothetical protein